MIHRTVYMYTIATVHLDFFRALQVSRPDTRAHIRVPHIRSAVPHHDPALLPDSGSAILTDSMT